MPLRPDHDEDWLSLAAAWDLPPHVTNLNHGSFGLAPHIVRAARDKWTALMDREPMEFFTRRLEPAWLQARQALAECVGTSPDNLVLVDNATHAMNGVASSFRLRPGDQVLLNNHEYGAVRRIWERACREAGAELVVAELPANVSQREQLIDPLLAAMNSRTRLLVVSHISSPTAITFPLEPLLAAARERNIATCIDGPHAVAQLPLDIDTLQCDFYTASCHKWLCAPLGSGFLYVHPAQQQHMRPPLLSWGRLLPHRPERWDEEFLWQGTGNVTANLAIPAAIAFLEQVGWEAFRKRTHWLARTARQQLQEILQTPDCVPADPGWYGCMARVELPPGDWSGLQTQLREEDGIEIPVIPFQDRWYLRVSCHLHTMTSHLDRLTTAVQQRVVACS